MDTYLFDMNDTIIDSSIYQRMNKELISVLAEKSSKTEEQIKQMFLEVNKETGGLISDSYDLSKKLGATEIYYDILEKYTKHTFVLKTKNIRDIFKKIKAKNKKIGIVSNSQERTIDIFLTRFNLKEYVDFVETGMKNTVLFWITLAKKHNLEKENTLMIDDSKTILDLAKHAGFNVLNIDHINELEL